jgi:hypothetical protein
MHNHHGKNLHNVIPPEEDYQKRTMMRQSCLLCLILHSFKSKNVAVDACDPECIEKRAGSFLRLLRPLKSNPDKVWATFDHFENYTTCDWWSWAWGEDFEAVRQRNATIDLKTRAIEFLREEDFLDEDFVPIPTETSDLAGGLAIELDWPNITLKMFYGMEYKFQLENNPSDGSVLSSQCSGESWSGLCRLRYTWFFSSKFNRVYFFYEANDGVVMVVVNVSTNADEIGRISSMVKGLWSLEENPGFRHLEGSHENNPAAPKYAGLDKLYDGVQLAVFNGQGGDCARSHYVYYNATNAFVSFSEHIIDPTDSTPLESISWKEGVDAAHYTIFEGRQVLLDDLPDATLPGYLTITETRISDPDDILRTIYVNSDELSSGDSADAFTASSAGNLIARVVAMGAFFASVFLVCW